MRIMRERERLQREEEMRMKRDIRTQHILEVGSPAAVLLFNIVSLICCYSV